MDQEKILFVLREPEDHLAEAVAYLRALALPTGMTAEIVNGGETNVAHYGNKAETASEAKYKVYLAPGSVILQKDLLVRTIETFRKCPDIGILGVLGTEQLPTSGFFQNAAHKIGRALAADGKSILGEPVEGEAQVVQSLSGGLLITQYDIPWREDLFLGDVFLAASLCAEMRRAGHQAAVLRTEEDALLLAREPETGTREEQDAFLDEYSTELFPLVSVIIPTYQRPAYFRQALASVVAQTYRNLDIFITDNSHNTETKKVYEKYFARDQRIHYEWHPDWGAAENWGCARAYNNPEARYVNWLMDDDLFMPEKIATMMNYFFAYPDLMLVTSYRRLIDAEGRFLQDLPQTEPFVSQTARIPGEDAGRQILRQRINFIGEPTTALAKKSGMLGGYQLGWTGREGKYGISDFPTWLRLLTQGDMVYIREPLSCFRLHAGQDQGQISTILAGAICWGMMLQAALAQQVFLSSEADRREALLGWLASTTRNFQEALIMPALWQETALQDLLKVYAGIANALAQGGQIHFDIDTGV